jgi:hypothetical protein
MTIDLPQGLKMDVQARINNSIGGTGYEIKTSVESPDHRAEKDISVNLVGLRASLSTAPGYALIESTWRYKRAKQDKGEEVVIEGKSLRDINAFDKVITYSIPEFFETSTEITLPSMIVNGQRVDFTPITLHKGFGTRALCAH